MAGNHDFVGHLVKFNSQSSGRDKCARLIQYASKFIWWHLQQRGFDPGIIIKLKNLDNALSIMRKTIRIGKSIDFIHSALHTIHLSDGVLRLTITSSKLNQAFYLLFDHLIWADKIGIAKVNTEKWKNLSARFWLVTILLNLIRDIYGIWQVILEELAARQLRFERSNYVNGDVSSQHKTRHIPSNIEFTMYVIQENIPLLLDLLRNLCDLILPLSALKRVNASTGVQGLFGALSSLVGILTTWNPNLKLVPS